MMQHELDPEQAGGGGPPEGGVTPNNQEHREDNTPDEANQETPDQTERQEVRDRQARQEALLRISAQATVERLREKLKNGEELNDQEIDELFQAQEIMAALGRGAEVNRELREELAGKSAAEILTERDRLFNKYQNVEEQAYIDNMFEAKKQHEQTAAYYIRSAGYMREHWSTEVKREWMLHQMHVLLSSRTAPTSAEQQLAYEALQNAGTLIKGIEDLEKMYAHFLKLYDHFTRMLTSPDLDPIVNSAVEKFKAYDINDMFKIPLVPEAFRIWDQNGSYKEYLKDRMLRGVDIDPANRQRRPLESVIVLEGGGLKLRKLAMTGEMVKWKLADEIKERFKRAGAYPDELTADREARMAAYAYVDRNLESMDFLDSRIHQEKPKVIPTDIPPADRARMEESWNGWAEEEYVKQQKEMLRKINAFIETDETLKNKISDSFFTKEGETVEQAQLSKKAEREEGEVGDHTKEYMKRSKGEVVFEDAQFSLELGEAVWRTFERASFMDGANPNAATPEGGGENPLRRLLSMQKYVQELSKDGKLKHVQPQLVEHLVNPVRDFISDPGHGFWMKQPEIVQKWYYRIVSDRDKVDKFGRFLDLSDCPIEYIDFSYYQEIPDRSPFAPHYSNYSELVEELRKQEVLIPGNLLETPTLENYIKFVKLFRNLRSDDSPEHKKDRDEEKALARQHRARNPNVSREDASYELFKGLMKYWKDYRVLPKEAVANAILLISDPYQETFITLKQRDQLMKDLFGPIMGSKFLWPVRLTLGKIDWGAGFLNGLKAFFKEVFKQK